MVLASHISNFISFVLSKLIFSNFRYIGEMKKGKEDAISGPYWQYYFCLFHN